MEDYTWANGHFTSTKDDTPSKVSVVRRSDILVKDGERAQVSVSRFQLRAQLPLVYTGHLNWAICIHPKGDPGAKVFVDVDFGTDGFLYDYRKVARTVSNTLSTVADGLSILEADWPAMKFDAKTVLFSVITTSTFRSSWEIYFNPKMADDLCTFEFEDNGMLVIEEDITEQPEDTLEFLSPVKKILLKTTLPIKGELNPIEGEGNSSLISNNTETFMVDMTWNQLSNKRIPTIQYTVGDASAGSGVYRWYTLLSLDVKDFIVEWFWVDKHGVNHPILLSSSGYADLKVVFRTL